MRPVSCFVLNRACSCPNTACFACRIDGTTDASKKQIMKNAFQDNPAIQVALIGLTAAGVGLSFTAASTALFAELHWTPVSQMYCV
jgi:SNF2 family DNA or RNA helicase